MTNPYILMIVTFGAQNMKPEVLISKGNQEYVLELVVMIL